MAVLRSVAVPVSGSVSPEGRVLPRVGRFRSPVNWLPHHSGTPPLRVPSPLPYAPPLRSIIGVWSCYAPPSVFICWRLPMPQSRSVPCSVGSVSSLPLIDHPSTAKSTGALPLAHMFKRGSLHPSRVLPQLRGNSVGVPRPALSRSRGPPSPSRSTPLPLVAPRHGGRGYGRAVVGLRPPLFCRLAREPIMALSRYCSGCRFASPCVRYASAAPFWVPAPALIRRVFKIPNIDGTFHLLRYRIPSMLGISKTRQTKNNSCGLAPKKVPFRALAPHPPT